MQADEELFTRIKQGDLSAFDPLYERHKRGLFRYVYGFLKNEEEAEEVFHEAFMQVLKANELSFEQGSFQGWLYLVARNASLNRIRTRERGERAADALGADEPSPSAETLLAERDVSMGIRKAAEGLPANLAQVFQLRLNGLPNVEIARVLRVPVGTVKSRVHAIVRFFRAEMES
jgi:RNA polymerase sigma-70 factor, ECF subfamily